VCVCGGGGGGYKEKGEHAPRVDGALPCSLPRREEWFVPGCDTIREATVGLDNEFSTTEGEPRECEMHVLTDSAQRDHPRTAVNETRQ
jgi:hypothetical protein